MFEEPGREGVKDIVKAAREGDLAEVRRLVESDRALLNVETRYGNSALSVAVSTRNLEMVRFLLEQGADVNRQGQRRLAVLHVACQSGSRAAPVLVLVRLLLEHGADVAAVDANGWTGLMWAAACGRTEVIDLLLRHEGGRQVDVNHRSRQGVTALWLAANAGAVEAVRCLLEAGADPGSRTEFRTAQHQAARQGQAGCVAVLKVSVLGGGCGVWGVHAP